VSLSKIGFGGGCHWCTEAVFQSLNGVIKVEQGWVSAAKPNDAYAEGVIVHFSRDIIDLAMLISVHLHTHSCTSTHSLRRKYRSAIYAYSNKQLYQAKRIISSLQSEFDKLIITKPILLDDFKLNNENYLNYYARNPERQFCQTYINPKLKVLQAQYSDVFKKV
jgi:peptide-methionine (S)-S-oxide reductase